MDQGGYWWIFCEWSLVCLWVGWSDTLILWHAVQQCREKWQPWMAFIGPVRGQAKLSLFYILDPFLFNFFLHQSSSTHTQKCLLSHSSRACYPHKLILVAIGFQTSDLQIATYTVNVISSLHRRSSHSAASLNHNIKNICIAVLSPKLAHSRLSWFFLTLWPTKAPFSTVRMNR